MKYYIYYGAFDVLAHPTPFQTYQEAKHHIVNFMPNYMFRVVKA